MRTNFSSGISLADAKDPLLRPEELCYFCLASLESPLNPK